MLFLDLWIAACCTFGQSFDFSSSWIVAMPTLLVSGWLLRQMGLFGLVGTLSLHKKQVKLKYLVYLLWLDDLPMIFHIMLESLHIWLTLWPQFLTTPPSLKPSATCFLFSPNLVKLFGNWLWSGEGHWNHFYSIGWHLRGGWVGVWVAPERWVRSACYKTLQGLISLAQVWIYIL